MAAPRVFISSTCYDLAEVRDSLVPFCQGFGFDVVLSDKGDVFYHPDLHTHESCIHEVSNCQLFILIIGGRFGGEYSADKSKSITNAEYSAARECNIPVFTFVKEGVLSDHFLYQKNKGKEFSSNIEYPSIDGNRYADDIFRFIDQVRGADVNNGFFPFKYARDLQELLRKQWAGMFFDFLSQRSVSNQLKSTGDAISNISIVSSKVESLLKRLYEKVDEPGAKETISNIDSIAEAKKFFAKISLISGENFFLRVDNLVEFNKNLPTNVEDFFLKQNEFEIVTLGSDTPSPRYTESLVNNVSMKALFDVGGERTKEEIKAYEELKAQYMHFVSLAEDVRLTIAEQYWLPF